MTIIKFNNTQKNKWGWYVSTVYKKETEQPLYLHKDSTLHNITGPNDEGYFSSKEEALKAIEKFKENMTKNNWLVL